MTRPLDDHGRVLAGRYELLRLLGRGGMSEVHLAHDRELGRHVAVKFLATGADGVERLRDEARATAALDHPGIVTVHDIGTADGAVFVVMAHLDGESLAERIRRDGALDVDQVVRIGRTVCSALDAAHRAGIVHRDISPGNIMLCRDGTVTVTDFGIARTSGGASRTATGLVIGTPAYLSPEQARGEPVDGRSDLYSLGCCLYAALTGRAPFDGPDSFAVALRQIHDDPVPPRTLRPGIPEALEAVVLRALAKDPAQRPPDAAAMGAALRRAGSRDEPTVPSASPAPSAASPAPSTSSGADRFAALDATLAEADPDEGDRADRRRSIGLVLMIVAAGLIVLVVVGALLLR